LERTPHRPAARVDLMKFSAPSEGLFFAEGINGTPSARISTPAENTGPYRFARLAVRGNPQVISPSTVRAFDKCPHSLFASCVEGA
jgi:hypothetical protein